MSEELESFADLEAVLLRLQPRRPSAELRRRIGSRLNVSRVVAVLPRQIYLRWGLLAAACSVLVGLSVWLFDWGNGLPQHNGQGIGIALPGKKNPEPQPQTVQIAAGWRIEPTGNAEYRILKGDLIRLDRGELLVECVPLEDGTQPRSPLSIETPAGKVTADDTKFYVGTHLLESVASIKPKGSAMTTLTRVLILAGAVTLANAEGSISGQANHLLAAETDKAPVNYALAANSDFAVDLYQQLAKERPGKNLFFSPYSISSALAMAAEGARGETAIQMGKVLRFPDAARRIGDDAQLIPWNTALIHTGMAVLNERFNNRKPVPQELLDRIKSLRKELDSANEAAKDRRDFDRYAATIKHVQEVGLKLNELLRQVDQYELHVANALWGEKSAPFQPSYVNTIHKFYSTGGLFPVDFKTQPDAARDEINAWVEEQTHSRIKNLIPKDEVDGLTRLVLANAIYFKGNWDQPFEQEHTHERDFAVSADKAVKVPLMFQEESYPYLDNVSLQALELPYKGDDLSMLVLLPKDKAGLADLEKSLSATKIADLRSKLRSQEVEVTLPKFKLETSFTLNDTLATLGMKLPFTAGADFLGMTGTRDLFISAVLHKAFVEVNEQGTEAAAATAVAMAGKDDPEPKKTPVFQADHPFVFMICDKRDGSILFLGRITDPSQQQ